VAGGADALCPVKGVGSEASDGVQLFVALVSPPRYWRPYSAMGRIRAKKLI